MYSTRIMLEWLIDSCLVWQLCCTWCIQYWYTQPVFIDCEQATITSPRENTAVIAGDSTAITCSVTCTGSQTPTLTLYKNPSSPEIVGTGTSGQPISFNVQREEYGVAFYCDVDDWLIAVQSRALSFNVLCKFCGFRWLFFMFLLPVLIL